MEIEDWKVSQGDLMRIIQEPVLGKQIAMVHIIASPDEIIYRRSELDPRVGYYWAAIGMLTLTPGETAIITAGLVIGASAIQIGFTDRFGETLIITGTIPDIGTAFERTLEYISPELGSIICRVTKA